MIKSPHPQRVFCKNHLFLQCIADMISQYVLMMTTLSVYLDIIKQNRLLDIDNFELI